MPSLFDLSRRLPAQLMSDKWGKSSNARDLTQGGGGLMGNSGFVPNGANNYGTGGGDPYMPGNVNDTRQPPRQPPSGLGWQTGAGVSPSGMGQFAPENFRNMAPSSFVNGKVDLFKGQAIDPVTGGYVPPEWMFPGSKNSGGMTPAEWALAHGNGANGGPMYNADGSHYTREQRLAANGMGGPRGYEKNMTHGAPVQTAPGANPYGPQTMVKSGWAGVAPSQPQAGQGMTDPNDTPEQAAARAAFYKALGWDKPMNQPWGWSGNGTGRSDVGV